MTELVSGCDQDRTGWNPELNRKLGAPLCQALTAFNAGDYETTVDLMRPIRYDLVRRTLKPIFYAIKIKVLAPFAWRIALTVEV